MDAVNAPIRRTRKEVTNSDLPIEQRDTLDITNSLEHENIIVSEGSLQSDFAMQLAFNEEPVEILIQPGNERFPAKVADCWVNGRGAEVFLRGKWESLGYLPVGMPVITKRKYVECLANSKVDNIQTDHGDMNDKDPQNLVVVNTSAKTNFTVISDKNPLGREWLSRLMRQRG